VAERRGQLNVAYFCRVATNLEYSGIYLNMENSGILREFCATSGKNCNKRSILVRHSNICVKQLLTCYTAGVDVE